MSQGVETLHGHNSPCRGEALGDRREATIWQYVLHNTSLLVQKTARQSMCNALMTLGRSPIQPIAAFGAGKPKNHRVESLGKSPIGFEIPHTLLRMVL
jgi:hypothetical protein